MCRLRRHERPSTLKQGARNRNWHQASAIKMCLAITTTGESLGHEKKSTQQRGLAMAYAAKHFLLLPKGLQALPSSITETSWGGGGISRRRRNLARAREKKGGGGGGREGGRERERAPQLAFPKYK